MNIPSFVPKSVFESELVRNLYSKRKAKALRVPEYQAFHDLCDNLEDENAAGSILPEIGSRLSASFQRAFNPRYTWVSYGPGHYYDPNMSTEQETTTTPAPKPQHVYGCYNREPYKDQMALKRTPEQVHLSQPRSFIPFRMAKDCQYTNTALGQADERCEGCSWRSPQPKST